MSAKVFYIIVFFMIETINLYDIYHVIVNRDCLVSGGLYYNKK